MYLHLDKKLMTTNQTPRVKKVAARESQSHHLTQKGCSRNFLNFSTQSNPKRDNNNNMGSIKINLDCVKKALSAIRQFISLKNSLHGKHFQVDLIN